MRYLRQSTIVTVQVGPFLDMTDGTAENALAATLTVQVSKAGAAFAARSSATAIAFDADGFYRVELNATDTATNGPLLLKSFVAGVVAVWHEFTVMAAARYDSAILGTAVQPVNLTQIDGLATNNWSATLNLKQVSIYNTVGTALDIGTDSGNGIEVWSGAGGRGVAIWAEVGDGMRIGSSNGNALNLEAAGTGHALSAVAINTGHGIYAEGGGDGIRALSQFNNGVGIRATGNGTGAGLLAVGGTSGAGAAFTGGTTTGSGIKATGGPASHGVETIGGTTSGVGIKASGTGTGHAMHLVGGGSGHGLYAAGVNGIYASGTVAGLNATGATNGHGIYAAGAGTGSGLYATGAGTGHGIRAVGVGGDSAGMSLQGGTTFGAGLRAVGGSGGNGIDAAGGSTLGSGIRATTSAGNGAGAIIQGGGYGAGLQLQGGPTGSGLEAWGGATSGSGINALTQGGNSPGIAATGSGTGMALSDPIVDSILDRAITEPTTIWAWPGSLRKILGWIGALSRNKVTQTNTLQSVRTDLDTASIATSTHGDDGTTHTRNKFL